MAITVRDLRALKPGEWAWDGGARGLPSLRVKAGANGAWWAYCRYRHDGRYDDLPLGPLTSLEDARAQVQELAKRYRAGETDLRGALAAEAAAAAAAREAQEAATRAAANRPTLGRLLDAYVEALVASGKTSATAVAAAFRRNVHEPWPELVARPIEAVDVDDLLAIVARVVERGHRREAARLRSCIRAAYSAAVAARRDPSAPAALRDLRITANPARDLSTIKAASQPRDRALSLAELRAYWTAIKDRTDPLGACLRLHLATGAQRWEQLRRATRADIDHDIPALRLLDPKGRREAPRVHWVPLTGIALAAIEACSPPEKAAFVLSATGGKTGADYAAAARTVRDIAAGLVAAGVATSPFTVGDLRRSVETRLAALGVPVDVRAHLQSHGLGGVQSRHYDRHDRLDEKRGALERLEALFTGDAGTVTPLRRSA